MNLWTLVVVMLSAWSLWVSHMAARTAAGVRGEVLRPGERAGLVWIMLAGPAYRRQARQILERRGRDG